MNDFVKIKRQVLKIVVPGPVGPQGPAGPDGPPGGQIEMTVGSTGLLRDRAVAVDASGKLVLADCTVQPVYGQAMWFSDGDYNEDDLVQVAPRLMLSFLLPVFSGPGTILLGTNGEFVESGALPLTAVFSQLLGYAINTTTMVVRLAQPVLIPPT